VTVAWRLAAVVAATAAVASYTAVPAGADPVGNARAKAAALAKTVQQLQTQTEVAAEHYDAIEAQLGAAVTAKLQSERDLDAARAGSDTVESVSADRVRALYESGGPTSLLATVLDGSDLTDALARYHDVSVVLGTDRSAIAAAGNRTSKAEDVSARVSTAAAEVTRLQTAASSAAARVQTLLSANQQALAGANAEVRRLVAQQQAAQLAASSADFRTAVAAAGGTVDASTAAANPIAAAAIAAARTKLGDPYLWGGTGPDAYDCSGLTQFAYGSVGVSLPRVAADQWNVGQHVGLDELEPGDLLFWATDLSNPATIHHVAIYIGNGMMLAAPHTGDVVKIEPVYMDGYIGATRPYDNG
jgi:peptidoglycan DL-endopeptidase CwlO